MAGVTGTYGKDYILAAAFANGAQRVSYRLALLTAKPAPDDDGSELAEVVAADYARITVAASVFTADSGAMYNESTVTFPTATNDWGVIRYWALTTALTGGEFITAGRLTTAKRVNTGSVASFEPGALSLALFDTA